ncbi:hypothetical protein B0188_07465 [[Haemophilus] felis]|uniref:Uncharacterized protein n=1 Tax=[Haemophilus] felis TaxID=123822 RepID=A0A1T0AY74_9PAST|nr:hypothetical protein B0188_07465 [[Haemophilus] felis]
MINCAFYKLPLVCILIVQITKAIIFCNFFKLQRYGYFANIIFMDPNQLIRIFSKTKLTNSIKIRTILFNFNFDTNRGKSNGKNR